MHRTAAVETRGCHGLAGRGTFTLLLGSAMDTTLKYHYMAVPTAAHPESKLLALRRITRRSGCTHALKKYFTAGTCLAVLFRRTKLVFPGSPCILLTSATELTLSPINNDSIYRGIKLGNQDLGTRLSHCFQVFSDIGNALMHRNATSHIHVHISVSLTLCVCVCVWSWVHTQTWFPPSFT